PAVIFNGCHDQATFSEVETGRHLATTHQLPSFHRTIEFARINLTERNAKRLEGIPNLFGNFPALVAQESLLHDVIMMQWLGVYLIAIGGAVAEHNDVATLSQFPDQRLHINGLRVCTYGKERQQHHSTPWHASSHDVFSFPGCLL